jgi:hypothetical protein
MTMSDSDILVLKNCHRRTALIIVAARVRATTGIIVGSCAVDVDVYRPRLAFAAVVFRGVRLFRVDRRSGTTGPDRCWGRSNLLLKNDDREMILGTRSPGPCFVYPRGWNLPLSFSVR